MQSDSTPTQLPNAQLVRLIRLQSEALLAEFHRLTKSSQTADSALMADWSRRCWKLIKKVDGLEFRTLTPDEESDLHAALKHIYGIVGFVWLVLNRQAQ